MEKLFIRLGKYSNSTSNSPSSLVYRDWLVGPLISCFLEQLRGRSATLLAFRSHTTKFAVFTTLRVSKSGHFPPLSTFHHPSLPRPINFLCRPSPANTIEPSYHIISTPSCPLDFCFSCHLNVLILHSGRITSLGYETNRGPLDCRLKTTPSSSHETWLRNWF